MKSQGQKEIELLAKKYGWKLEWHKKEYSELYFRKGDCGLTIWYSNMTIRTALTHPKMGKTQMYRKRVNLLLMDSIFKNPRKHTDKGYYEKTTGNKRNWRRTNKTDIYDLK